MLYPVQTSLSFQELKRLDKTCYKKGVSRYEYIKQAIIEKMEHDRTTQKS